MTIRAHHLTLLHLGKDGFPTSRAQTRCNAELLVIKMIELKDDWVVLSTVDAWIGRKEIKKICGAFFNDPLSPG